jgi:predicted GIY-YIG superfamily endonuclease
VDVSQSARPAGPVWSVFILRNPGGRHFVGHTADLPGFLSSADADVAKWTGQPGPWPLVWQHDGLTEEAARKYEVSLKRDKNSPRFYERTGLKAPEVPTEPPPQPPVEPPTEPAAGG